jgi:F-type H+-transporting ATPase subunit b
MANNAHGAAPAPHAAGTQVPDGHDAHGVFPPFDSTHFGSQLLWLAIVFGLLYTMMSKVALPRVGNILDTRKRRIDADLEAARQAQAQAEAAQIAHERTLADAKTKAQAMAQSAHATVAAETDAKRKTLEDQLAANLAAADAKIAETKARAMANVGQIAQDAAGAIVTQLTGKTVDASKIAAAVANSVRA